METRRYRTIPETIELFKNYSFSFEADALRALRDGNTEQYAADHARAQAYEIAAFELEHNVDWKGERKS